MSTRSKQQSPTAILGGHGTGNEIRKKLSNLADSFNGFEQQIQKTKLKKKDNDEKKLIEIK